MIEQSRYTKRVIHKITHIAVAALFLIALVGCGLEVLMFGLPTGGNHEAPTPEKVTKLEGKADGFGNASVVLRAGQSAITQGQTTSDGSFSLELPKGTDFSNLLLEVQKDSALLWAIIPEIKREEITQAGVIDLQSTTAGLLLLALLSAQGLDLINYPAGGLKLAVERIKAQLQQEPAITKLFQMVQAIHEAAKSRSGANALFQIPVYRNTSDKQAPPEKVKSALTDSALSPGIDYCKVNDEDGCKDGPETTSEPFDVALSKAIRAVTMPTCKPKDTIQVVLTATISPTAKDGNCSVVNQFKHAKRYGGAACEKCKVYFTGSVHKDSGIQDEKIAQILGNWQPNQVAMYDDGTNGDLVAGDGIWTITFAVPAPQSTGKSCSKDLDCEQGSSCLNNVCHKVLRLGYKYTYGLSGDVWGGTEEFPGNQRVLEIVDHNGDGFVARHDVFADETANKDKVNTLQRKGVTGMVCFVEPPADRCGFPIASQNHPDCGCKADQDGDGIPDVRERPWDSTHDCKPDGWRVFANVQPLVQSCSY